MTRVDDKQTHNLASPTPTLLQVFPVHVLEHSPKTMTFPVTLNKVNKIGPKVIKLSNIDIQLYGKYTALVTTGGANEFENIGPVPWACHFKS